MHLHSPLTIGKLAKSASINVETVRYYERIGIIARPQERLGKRRVYGKEHLLKIRFIKRAQELGFTLKEIRKLLLLRVRRTGSCRAVRGLAALKIKDIEHRISDLQRIKDKLQELVQSCDSKQSTTECPIIDVMDGSPCCSTDKSATRTAVRKRR